jgi:hypothetical protein
MERKVSVKYLLSKEGQKQSLLSGGDGKGQQLALADITPEAIALASIAPDGTATIDLTDVQVDICIEDPGYCPPRIAQRNRFSFDALQTGDALVAWETNRRTRIAQKAAELQPELERLTIAYNERAALCAAQNAERDARRDARVEAAQKRSRAEKEAMVAEKANWIAAHGSDHLKRAYALGYDCQRKYATERAAAELPDLFLDYDDHAEWRSRSCPSEKALDEVEKLAALGYKAQVVWLTYPPYKLDYECEDFQPMEAVVILDYLGKYTLVVQ